MYQKSEEYARFEALVDGLLTVPKTVIRGKMDAHREKVAAQRPPEKRLPEGRRWTR